MSRDRFYVCRKCRKSIMKLAAVATYIDCFCPVCEQSTRFVVVSGRR